MADKDTATPPPEGEKKDILTMGELRKVIVETVQGVVSNLTPPKGDDKSDPKDSGGSGTGGAGIAEEVKREIARMKEREGRVEREKTIDQTLASLVEKTQEKQPIERRRVHKFMGWGDPAQ